MDVDNVHSEINSASDGNVVIETEEEILVYVNVDDANDDFTAEDLQSFKVIGVDTDEPIIQVGDKFFGGRWDEVVGTAVFFKPTTPHPKRCYFSPEVPKPLKYVGKTQKSLNLKRAFVTHSKNDEDNPDVVNDPSKAKVQDSTNKECSLDIASNYPNPEVRDDIVKECKPEMLTDFIRPDIQNSTYLKEEPVEVVEETSNLNEIDPTDDSTKIATENAVKILEELLTENDM